MTEKKKDGGKPIGVDEIRQATLTLRRYREGKAALESRILENERWYRMRHWESLRRGRKNEVEPVSGWLFNAIANKHADAMDNFPEPNILPREEADRAEARLLSAIVPAQLAQCGFEQVYSDVWDYKLKTGTGVYGVFWDPDAKQGRGDIAVRKIDLLNLFWEKGVTDIQASRNLFHVEPVSAEVLRERYPELEDVSLTPTAFTGQYDENADLTDKCAVVDWYYKRRIGGKTVLHYCKFVGETVLFASENEPEYAERGWYDHGLYPFLFDPLFRVEGSACGFGYIDVGKSAQEYIDRGNQAILQNLLANTRPRYFIRSDGAVNEREYGDYTLDFVHVDGALGADSVLPITGKPLSSIYVQVISNKIDELKEVTGNRDVSTGGTVSGVTAASAIAAMQEAGSKLSRDHIKSGYRVFRALCQMVIALLRQFYSVPRAFRVPGEHGEPEFLLYSNAGLLPQEQGDAFGVALGMRVPEFDIEISAQKQSPYSKLSQNEMAMSFFTAGLFDPARREQALACLDMMDFERKEMVMQRIASMTGAALPAAAAATAMPSEPGVTKESRVAAAGR